jgi:uncharacterized protein (UPF0548 family)
MFCLDRPDELQARDYLAGQADREFSYARVGFTREPAALNQIPGWCVDRHRVVLGHGEAAFSRARAAIEAWKIFPAEITNVYGREQPRVGLTVAVSFQAWPFPLWLLMPARVVYVVDDSLMRDGEPIERFGFAYGTLPDHPERGEERFLVEWNRADETVHYDLLAVSRPNGWLVRLGYPYARQQQAGFRRLSGLAMQRAVVLAS